MAQGSQGLTGAQGVQGDAGPGSVGGLYLILGTTSGGGNDFLELLTANSNIELLIWCDKDAFGAYWMANDASVTAGSVTIINQEVANSKGDRSRGFMLLPMFYNDLAFGSGAQDEAFEKGGQSDGGKMAWNGKFTAIEGATITRWDVTLNNFPTSGSDCSVVVYANGTGSAQVVTVP